MQVWPPAAKTPATMPLVTASRSASSKTTWADLPPSSSVTPRQVAHRRLRDLDPDRRRPGEGELVDARVRGQRLAGLRRRAGDDVEDARRQPRLLEAARELERRDRRVVGGLRDQRAAGRERRRDLPGQQHQRRVPRHDRPDDADGLVARVDQVVAPVGLDRVAVDLVGEPREVAVPGRQRGHLAGHLAQQLAVVAASRSAPAPGRRAPARRRCAAAPARARSRSSAPTGPTAPRARRAPRGRRPRRRPPGPSPTARRGTGRACRRSRPSAPATTIPPIGSS